MIMCLNKIFVTNVIWYENMISIGDKFYFSTKSTITVVAYIHSGRKLWIWKRLVKNKDIIFFFSANTRFPESVIDLVLDIWIP